jgi:uncharacterized membrane protein YheB (UPF0754 family)
VVSNPIRCYPDPVITEPSLLRAAVTIFFGAAAGGLTNLVAIWMLFHPHERRGLGVFRFQGAIPKNKPRLAKTIGRTVGEKLLSAEDLHHQLTAPGIQEAFDSAVRGFVKSALDSERGSLRDELPENLVPEIDTTIASVAQIIADRVVEYASTDDFRDTTAEFLTKTRDRVADKSVGLVLTGARREAVRDRVEQWVAEAAASPDLDRIVAEWMDRQLVSLAADSTPLIEKLPPTLVAAVEKEIADYLPLAIDRLAGVLRNPEARGRIQEALHNLFERFVRDLMIHERIVARLVVTERTIAKVLDNFEREGADQLGRLLDQPEMRAQVARSVNDAVVSFLRKPMSDHMSRLGAERLEGVKHTAAEYVAKAVRDPATRRYGIDKLDQALQTAEGRTWGDLLKYVPPDQAADWVAEAVRDPKMRGWIAEGARTALTALLNRRIGRPASLLPEGGVDRIADRLSPVLWDWTKRQVPVVLETIDVQKMVEEKVLGFSLVRIEEIVRSTTQRELDVIVRLGWVLGAFVGLAAYCVSLIL